MSAQFAGQWGKHGSRKYVLVTSEVLGGLACSLPFARGRTKIRIVKTCRLWPNSSIKHSNNNVAFNSWSFNILRKAYEIPRLCGVELFFTVRKYRYHAVHPWRIMQVKQIKTENITKTNRQQDIMYSSPTGYFSFLFLGQPRNKAIEASLVAVEQRLWYPTTVCMYSLEGCKENRMWKFWKTALHIPSHYWL